MAAASLGELTISALATATVIGNAQLAAAGRRSVRRRSRSATPGTASACRPSARGGRTQPATAPTEEPPQPSLEELLAELDALVGLEAVKTEVRHQTQLLRIQALRGSKGLRNPDLTRHLVFVGNPGTGKTTVARLVAGIYRAVGVLPKGHLVECDRSELVAGYVGQTAIKTAEVIDPALGGALFIDEAYALAGDEFGAEAIDTLVKEMEDHRDDLLVIVAGYPAPMEKFITSNPGLESRFRLTLMFDDYSDDELVEIFSRIASGADFTPTDDAVTRAARDPAGDATRRGVRQRPVRAQRVRVGGRAPGVAAPRRAGSRRRPAPRAPRRGPRGGARPVRRRGRTGRPDGHQGGRAAIMTSSVTTPPPPPPLPTGVPPADPAGPPPAPPAGSTAPTSVRARELLAGAISGTPGRMRVLGAIAIVAGLVFGVVGFLAVSGFHSDLDEARTNAEQLVRIQSIRTNLVTADANATNAFLVGGLEPPEARDAYTEGIATTARALAAASAARADDSTALERVNRVLTQYTGLIEAARANNRQGFPVGAAYLRQASRVLQDEALPSLATLGARRAATGGSLDLERQHRVRHARHPARVGAGGARRRRRSTCR